MIGWSVGDFGVLGGGVSATPLSKHLATLSLVSVMRVNHLVVAYMRLLSPSGYVTGNFEKIRRLQSTILILFLVPQKSLRNCTIKTSVSRPCLATYVTIVKTINCRLAIFRHFPYTPNTRFSSLIVPSSR